MLLHKHLHTNLQLLHLIKLLLFFNPASTLKRILHLQPTYTFEMLKAFNIALEMHYKKVAKELKKKVGLYFSIQTHYQIVRL